MNLAFVRPAAAVLAAGVLSLTGTAFAEPVQVTTTGGSHPTTSPDGAWLAYITEDGDLAKVPSGGGAPEVLDSGGSQPDWSWVHDLIVVRGGGALYTVDPVTHETALAVGSGVDDDPAWSPTGNEIAADVGGGVVVFSYPGGAPTSVSCSDPDGSDCEGEGPTWSPDGAWIAFEDGLDILKVRRTGGAAVNVLHGDDDVTHAAWSPDGDWIAVAMGDSSRVPWQNWHIWVVDARGSSFGLVQVTSGTFPSSQVYDRQPAWSPDTHTIYFSSSRSGRSEIWKVAFPPTAIAGTTWGALKTIYR
jgi:Tol biopolymer transport system component